ncbi:MAG: hypothetical protein ACT4N4_03250 [Rhodospirillales bacterium]
MRIGRCVRNGLLVLMLGAAPLMLYGCTQAEFEAFFDVERLVTDKVTGEGVRIPSAVPDADIDKYIAETREQRRRYLEESRRTEEQRRRYVPPNFRPGPLDVLGRFRPTGGGGSDNRRD